MTQSLVAPLIAAESIAAEYTGAIQSRLAPLRHQLQIHALYASIQTIDHLRLFMESHVFAVWDFMSLLKSLQRTLTCVDVPWVPTLYPASRRFINEIVFGEESDVYEGRPVSHFELYLQAMEQVHARTHAIRQTIDSARLGTLSLETAPAPAQSFVQSTFSVIRTGSPAAQAAAFAFGREDAIPAMFRSLVRNLNHQLSGDLSLFLWYLERHIEIDGDEHGPLALGMVADLCGDDPARWEEAAQAAENAIKARLTLWDGVLAQIQPTA